MPRQHFRMSHALPEGARTCFQPQLRRLRCRFSCTPLSGCVASAILTANARCNNIKYLPHISVPLTLARAMRGLLRATLTLPAYLRRMRRRDSVAAKTAFGAWQMAPCTSLAGLHRTRQLRAPHPGSLVSPAFQHMANMVQPTLILRSCSCRGED